MNIKILVVDDEADITTVLKRGLEKAGFEVDGFTDPNEAAEKIVPGKYAMLITDIRMPGMNGFELYRRAKKRDQNVKVSFMTAFEIYRDEFLKILPNIDVECFFTKPVRMNDMVSRIKIELGLTI